MRTWVLAARGHGEEWSRIFRVGPEHGGLVWEAIAVAVLSAPVTELRGGRFGITCGLRAELTILDRAATVLTAWHYDHRQAAPRLVTAYPSPYNRSHARNA